MIKKQLLVIAMAATLSTGMIASGVTSVFAADNPPASTAASTKDQAAAKEANKEFVKVSEDALMSMRDLHSTRLAIFNGQPDKARTYRPAIRKLHIIHHRFWNDYSYSTVVNKYRGRC